nr:GNAT family N-acetyltransferase [Paracoccus saliphilus]
MQPGPSLSRAWPEDAEAIAAALSNWDTVQWLTAVPWPYDAAAAAEFVQLAGLDEHAVRLDGRLVGMVRAGASFGMWIAPNLQGRGIGRRAAVLSLSRRFLKNPGDISSHHLIGNHRSARLLSWLGFRRAGEALLWSRALQRDVQAVSLTLSREAFEARHAIFLQTPRLRIGQFAAADLPALDRIAALSRMDGATAAAAARQDASEAIGGALLPPLCLAVRRKGQVVGLIGFSADMPPRLSFVIDPRHSGQGLGQEMVAAAFAELVARLAPEEVVADVVLNNIPARNILKNLGFQRSEDILLQAAEPADAARYRWRPAPRF